MTLESTQTLLRAGQWSGQASVCSLTYDNRFLRRKVLTSDDGDRFLVDLDHTTSINQGDAFKLSNGAIVEIHAAAEDLLEVTGDNLLHLAWHIGNRHTPCQIETGRLLIRKDHVLKDMLAKLGAKTKDVVEPFTPEGGAYGYGRTHSHSH